MEWWFERKKKQKKMTFRQKLFFFFWTLSPFVTCVWSDTTIVVKLLQYACGMLWKSFYSISVSLEWKFDRNWVGKSISKEKWKIEKISIFLFFSFFWKKVISKKTIFWPILAKAKFFLSFHWKNGSRGAVLSGSVFFDIQETRTFVLCIDSRRNTLAVNRSSQKVKNCEIWPYRTLFAFWNRQDMIYFNHIL